MSTLRTKNMELTGLVDIGEDGGSVSLYKNGEEYIITVGFFGGRLPLTNLF